MLSEPASCSPAAHAGRVKGTNQIRRVVIARQLLK